MYRRTRDGRRVTALWRLPILRHRFFLVPDEARGAFERRVKQAHIAALAAIAVGVQLIGDPDAMGFALFFTGLAVVVGPAMQAWMTRGLAAVSVAKTDLEPVTRSAQRLDYAHAAGAPTLWGLLLISVLLVVPQVYVVITDGVWWAWLGAAMFGAMAVYFGGLLLRLRHESRAPGSV